MADTPIKREIYLLPFHFKWVGAALIVLAVVLFIVMTLSDTFLSFDKNYGIPVTVILAGLAIVTFSKEKIEDERIRRIRYKTWSYTFGTICSMVIFGRILNQIFGVDLHYFSSAAAVLLSSLIINLCIFAANKEFDAAEE